VERFSRSALLLFLREHQTKTRMALVFSPAGSKQRGVLEDRQVVLDSAVLFADGNKKLNKKEFLKYMGSFLGDGNKGVAATHIRSATHRSDLRTTDFMMTVAQCSDSIHSLFMRDEAKLTLAMDRLNKLSAAGLTSLCISYLVDNLAREVPNL